MSVKEIDDIRKWIDSWYFLLTWRIGPFDIPSFRWFRVRLSMEILINPCKNYESNNPHFAGITFLKSFIKFLFFLLISEQHDGYKHTWSKIYFPFKYKSNYHSFKLSSNLLRELHLWKLQDENCWILLKLSRLCGVAVAKSLVSYAVFLWTCVGLSIIFCLLPCRCYF